MYASLWPKWVSHINVCVCVWFRYVCKSRSRSKLLPGIDLDLSQGCRSKLQPGLDLDLSHNQSHRSKLQPGLDLDLSLGCRSKLHPGLDLDLSHGCAIDLSCGQV